MRYECEKKLTRIKSLFCVPLNGIQWIQFTADSTLLFFNRQKMETQNDFEFMWRFFFAKPIENQTNIFVKYAGNECFFSYSTKERDKDNRKRRGLKTIWSASFGASAQNAKEKKLLKKKYASEATRANLIII